MAAAAVGFFERQERAESKVAHKTRPPKISPSSTGQGKVWHCARMEEIGHSQLQVSPSDVYTTFGSKLLEHTKAKLWETGMHNGSTVMANIRLRGGVCVPHTGNLKRRQNQVNTNHPIHGLVPKEYPLVFKKNLH